MHFFGVWGAADSELRKYLDQRHDLQAGRTPRLSSKGQPTTADIVNLWLKRCDDPREAGELQVVTFADYVVIGTSIVEHLGRHADPEQLRPTDFAAFRPKVATKYSQSPISKTVVVCQMIFKWTFESEHLERMPRFGPDFAIVSHEAKRIERAGGVKKLFTAEDVRALLPSEPTDAIRLAARAGSISARSERRATNSPGAHASGSFRILACPSSSWDTPAPRRAASPHVERPGGRVSRPANGLDINPRDTPTLPGPSAKPPDPATPAALMDSAAPKLGIEIRKWMTQTLL